MSVILPPKEKKKKTPLSIRQRWTCALSAFSPLLSDSRPRWSSNMVRSWRRSRRSWPSTSLWSRRTSTSRGGSVGPCPDGRCTRRSATWRPTCGMQRPRSSWAARGRAGVSWREAGWGFLGPGIVTFWLGITGENCCDDANTRCSNVFEFKALMNLGTTPVAVKHF